MIFFLNFCPFSEGDIISLPTNKLRIKIKCCLNQVSTSFNVAKTADQSDTHQRRAARVRGHIVCCEWFTVADNTGARVGEGELADLFVKFSCK